MKTLTKGLVSLALLTAAFTVGCGSSSGTDDAGAAGTTGAAGNGAAGADGGEVCQGITLFGLSAGDTCFDVVSVAAGSNDGCMLGVADPYDMAMMTGVIGSALPVNYDATTATLTVGTSGSLGKGTIMCNVGTLARDNMPTLSSHPACTWHQTDSSMVNITATNEFDIAVTENETTFSGCVAADGLPPAGGMCTSTWTWHMKKNAAKTPPACQ
jgi:hypothetical protein